MALEARQSSSPEIGRQGCGRRVRCGRRCRPASPTPRLRRRSTAFLIFCVGPLAILGPIKSALENDGTLIYTNAVLDLVTSAILAASFGKSVIFASPILFIWQGAIYVSALLFMKDTSPELLNELSLTGGFLIMATGLSILKIKDLKVINLLPALAVPPLFFAAKALF